MKYPNLGYPIKVDIMPDMLTGRYSIEQEALRRALRQLRAAQGITQRQLSNFLGVPQSFVSKYESGERTLSYVDVFRICTALGVNVSLLHERFLQEINETKS